MKYLYLFLIPLIFFSCNKDDFDKEHSQHIVGKWRWVETESHVNYGFNSTFETFTPTSTGKTLEIEFKKNGTTVFNENGKKRIRYLNKSANNVGEYFFNFTPPIEYYLISTSFTQMINEQMNFPNYIPVQNSDSLYSGYFPMAVSTSEGFIETYHAKSIFIRIE